MSANYYFLEGRHNSENSIHSQTTTGIACLYYIFRFWASWFEIWYSFLKVCNSYKIRVTFLQENIIIIYISEHSLSCFDWCPRVTISSLVPHFSNHILSVIHMYLPGQFTIAYPHGYSYINARCHLILATLSLHGLLNNWLLSLFHIAMNRCHQFQLTMPSHY